MILKWKFAVIYPILLLIFVLSFILAGLTFSNIKNFIDQKKINQIVNQIPDMEIKNGNLALLDQAVNSPVYIYHPDSLSANITGNQQVRPLMIIDTEFKGIPTYLPADLLLTKYSLFVLNKSGEISSYELWMKDLQINKKMLHSWQYFVQYWVPVIFIPFMIIALFILAILQACLLFIFSYLFTFSMEVDLDLDERFALSIFSLIPAIIVFTILNLCGIGCPTSVYCLIAVFYLFFGLLSMKYQNQDF
jgi:hypothetical protein